jgi:hypothetical protein
MGRQKDHGACLRAGLLSCRLSGQKSKTVKAVTLLHEDPDILGGIIAGIQPYEQRLTGKLPAQVNGLTEKVRGFFLAVLLSLTEFRIDKVTFRSYVRHDGA